MSSELKEVHARLAHFAKAVPEVAAGFRQLSKAAGAAGRFTPAQKELFAAAFGVVCGCEDCVVYHVDAARRLGAAREDLLELLAVAVEMGGGPAMVYGAKALKAFDEAN
ncbi:carboxymuconolactone decarboxylase family protein [Ancylobacter sp. SL191]|uniref:carboxymuconolactone decarboxylase family protein n=1 Tax=Ancylobacter sp. SL191 TaxID=2995166 RepID=UPI002270F874|nr:carboxymuconolactone decarboxylase family protein [Ancylobacter sp. SL191]WAC27601.1 carboxymuconolactone decarboxylase family protein [Ancylobacter sp. SL191]